MKKLALVLAATALVGISSQNANAGDREWAVAGKVLTGLAVASVISHAVEPAPVYQANPYSYSATPYAYAPPPPRVVYVQPAPVVVYRQPVVYAPAPVYVTPAPAVNVRIGFGHPHRHFRHSHYCW